MERLTFEGNFCDIAMCQENPCPYNDSCSQRETWERLKAYEETGLTPEEIRELTHDTYGPLHKKLGEWMEAESEGRLVVLPVRARTVAGRYECGTFYSDLTGDEISKILNAYANGKLVPATEETKC